MNFRFADFHCHPNLKTFGHSLSGAVPQASVWYNLPPTLFTKALAAYAGLTRYTQADFTTMCKGNVKIAMVSYYPFEKGFFVNRYINSRLAAAIANQVTRIGYKRVRSIQHHTDYYKNLEEERNFFEASRKTNLVAGRNMRWRMTSNYQQVMDSVNHPNEIAVIPTIEGLHVLNTGLSEYGRAVSEDAVMENLYKIKSWEYRPLFVTFAHNFNNDLCGHALSLEKLKGFVDQTFNLHGSFSLLGEKVMHGLLDSDRPVLIDVKHMSYASRLYYYSVVKADYGNRIPVVVSHGAVTGTSIKCGPKNTATGFCNSDINFFDEELIAIAQTNGIFAIQMDANRLASSSTLKKNTLHPLHPQAFRYAAQIVWNQLQHIAEVLDKNELPAWNTAGIGSDFDGTIKPLPGFWSAEALPLLATQLVTQSSP